jgi:hypothetical protein
MGDRNRTKLADYITMFRCDIREFAPLPCFYCLHMGSKLRCMRPTPTEMQSISEMPSGVLLGLA